MMPEMSTFSHKKEKLRLQLTVESARSIQNSWKVLKFRNLTLKSLFGRIQTGAW